MTLNSRGLLTEIFCIHNFVRLYIQIWNCCRDKRSFVTAPGTVPLKTGDRDCFEERALATAY